VNSADYRNPHARLRTIIQTEWSDFAQQCIGVSDNFRINRASDGDPAIFSDDDSEEALNPA
jgi:hypothetical protein